MTREDLRAEVLAKLGEANRAMSDAIELLEGEGLASPAEVQARKAIFAALEASRGACGKANDIGW